MRFVVRTMENVKYPTGLLHIIKSAGACCYVIRYFLHCHSLLFSLPNIVFGSALFAIGAKACL